MAGQGKRCGYYVENVGPCPNDAVLDGFSCVEHIPESYALPSFAAEYSAGTT